MKKTFFALFFIISSTLYAQSPKFVKLPGGGMVPCDHPLAINSGLGCTNRVTVTDYDCNSFINPYSEPDRAAYCSARTVRSPEPGNDYKIGQKYAHAYASNRMVVIGITRDIYNRPVITYQWYTGSHLNEVGSFIVGVTEQPWTLLNED